MKDRKKVRVANERRKKMLFVCYPKCSTCMKAKKWLEEKEIEFEQRDIKEERKRKN